MPSPEDQNPPSQEPSAEQRHDVLPTLFGDGSGLYEVRKGSFVVSFVLNTRGACAADLDGELDRVSCSADQAGGWRLTVDISPYIMPAVQGDCRWRWRRRFARPNSRLQGRAAQVCQDTIAPPTVLPMEQPKLPVAPTVVVPPEMKLPQTGPMGDPLSKVMRPAFQRHRYGRRNRQRQRRRSGVGKRPRSWSRPRRRHRRRSLSRGRRSQRAQDHLPG